MIALDIFIGLVLIYFLYALLVSIIAEMISTWIGMRARILRQGIDNILNDKNPGVDNKKDFVDWIKDIFVVEPKEFKYTHAGRFYREPTIKYLAKAGENEVYSIRNTKPAYISKENFTRTILNMLGQKSMGINEWEKIKFAIKHNTLALEPETLKMFAGWVLRSNDSYQQFLNNVCNTYAEMMDRVNGWYKRKIGLFIFWIGFGICMIMNVDSIQIVKTLADNPEKAQEMVKLAIATVDAEDKYQSDTTKQDSLAHDTAHLNHLKERYAATMNSIQKSQRIMANGWVFPDSIYSEKNKQFKKYFKIKHIVFQSLPFWKLKFWGLTITALALSLGSQFWFDLLKKLIAIRGAGVKPEEKPKDPNAPVIPIVSPFNDGLAQNTQDPVKIAIAQNRGYWESLKGVYGINISNKPNSIDLVIDEKLDTSILGPQIIKVPLGNKEIDVSVHIEYGTPAQNLLGDIGYIRLNGENKKGSVCGGFRNNKNGSKCLLTCAHVLQRNDSAFFNKNDATIFFKNNPDAIGKMTNMIASSFIDAAIIEYKNLSPDLMKYGIEEVKDIATVDNRNIDKIDKIEIQVIRNDEINIIVTSLLSTTYDYNFIKINENRFMYELIVLEQLNANNLFAEAGDSGSMVNIFFKSDEKKYAYAMLVGVFSKVDIQTTKVTNFALAISLSSLTDILNLSKVI